MTPSRITSVDVARRAGVSRATVSYVLNGRSDQSIPEITRQRVLSAARDLDYVPNAASRALRGGRSHLVLLVNAGVPWSTNITNTEDRLTADVAATGRSLVVWRRPGPDDLAATLANLEPCVVITLDSLSPDEERVLKTVGIPLVHADLGSPGADSATLAQVSHLAGRGHRRVAYLSTSEPSLQRFAAPRTEHFLAACADAGLPEPEIGVVAGGLAVDVGAVARQLSAWTTGPEPVTAVACFNDIHAAACIAAAADCGLAVPRDLSVMGLDDDIIAPLTRPALTTVRMDPFGFADRLWASALRLIGEVPPSEPVVTDALVVERASVDQPSKNGAKP